MAEWNTKDVREMVRFTQSHLFSLGHGRGHGPDERAEVDRNSADWLATHDAEVKAEALEQAADDWYDEANPITEGHWDCSPLVNEAPVLCRTPDEARSWLRARAAAIRGEQ